MPSVTVDDMIAWRACAAYERARIEPLFGGRPRLTAREVLALPIPAVHRLWEHCSGDTGRFLFPAPEGLRSIAKGRKPLGCRQSLLIRPNGAGVAFLPSPLRGSTRLFLTPFDFQGLTPAGY
jgi:hypothetical protein